MSADIDNIFCVAIISKGGDLLTQTENFLSY